MAACEKECWLEEYNRDDNRYNAGRGAHLTLKRAEKARTLVNKISGTRRLDIAGLPMRKHPLNAHELDSPMVRKPFPPISSTESLKPNIANLLEDLNKKHSQPFQKSSLQSKNNNTPFTTRSKAMMIPTAGGIEEENRTPKTVTISPSTPATVSVPMQSACVTPASSTPYNGNIQVQEHYGEIEYSFEERRLGYVVPGAHLKTILQV